jgi:hypothetical protein
MDHGCQCATAKGKAVRGWIQVRRKRRPYNVTHGFDRIVAAESVAAKFAAVRGRRPHRRLNVVKGVGPSGPVAATLAATFAAALADSLAAA